MYGVRQLHVCRIAVVALHGQRFVPTNLEYGFPERDSPVVFNCVISG